MRSAAKGEYVKKLFEKQWPGKFEWVIAEDLEKVSFRVIRWKSRMKRIKRIVKDGDAACCIQIGFLLLSDRIHSHDPMLLVDLTVCC